MPQCVFSMDYVYEDFGDVDNYIDSCGDYDSCKCPHTGCYFGTTDM